ncbi:hypothetical protein [Bacillus infantis]|uniref:hypothetical protein n=1 Tax=Bacillus infantis TaxID=324767 RepID=UPI003CF888B9
MSKWLGAILLGISILFGCAVNQETDHPKEATQKEPKEKPAEKAKVEIEESEESNSVEEVKTETKEEEKEETEVEQKATLPAKINKADFEAKFSLDTDETQYNDGKFQMGNGTKVQADYLFYSDDEVFDYASAIFHEGVLVDIQVETTVSIEELEKGLGVSFSEAKVNPYKYGYEINFDEAFAEGNISVYPNEWE